MTTRRKVLGIRNGLKIYKKLVAKAKLVAKKKHINKISKKRKAELPNWEKVKRQAFDRSQNRCEIQGKDCLQTYGITPHHIIHKSQLGKDELSNIIIGCAECHNHHKYTDGTPFTKEELSNKIGVSNANSNRQTNSNRTRI